MNHRPIEPWSPARRRLSLIAGGITLVTALAGATLGGTADHAVVAVAYIAITGAAAFRSSWLGAQVIAGQILAGTVLLGSAGPLPALPLIACVIATAELLAAAGRLDRPVRHEHGGVVRRAVTAAAIGGAVFGGVLVAGRLPGPTGLLATALASAGCVVLAILLVRGVARVPSNPIT